jgi:hypothetical protein
VLRTEPQRRSAARLDNFIRSLVAGLGGSLVSSFGLRDCVLRERAGTAGEEQGDEDQSLHAILPARSQSGNRFKDDKGVLSSRRALTQERVRRRSRVIPAFSSARERARLKAERFAAGCGAARSKNNR